MFITFEGIDGAGKSTQIALLAEYFAKNNIETVITREPGGTPFAEKLRELVLHTEEAICADTETMMMFASRAQHLNAVILPALRDTKTVICSRFSDATLAYQGYGRGIDIERIERLIDWTHKSHHPDLTFILDLDPEVGLTRRELRAERSDRFEDEKIEFMHRVRKGYLHVAKDNPSRCKVIDASQPADVIHRHITQYIETA